MAKLHSLMALMAEEKSANKSHVLDMGLST